jgi:hypothetical protein
MMITNRVFATAALVISITGASWAATPDQAGTWSGTAKVITFTGGTNKTVSKQPMQIEIALDNSTTITIGGVVQTMGGTLYNQTDGLCTYVTGNTIMISTFNFKNTTMKGTAVGFTVGMSSIVSTAEAKYKLKKQ